MATRASSRSLFTIDDNRRQNRGSLTITGAPMERRCLNSRGRMRMSASGAIGTTASFFSKSSIASVMQAANKVPPVTYFVYLIAAGVGEIPAGCAQQRLMYFGGALLADPRRTPCTTEFA